MVFASPIFLFLFLPITLLGYYLIHPKFRNFWLFLMSFIFYAWGGLSYALILLFSTLMNYLFGILIDKSKEKYKKSCRCRSRICNLPLQLVNGSHTEGESATKINYMGFIHCYSHSLW